MNKIRALIVDDEFFNRGLISMLINKLSSSFEICGEAESVSAAYKLIEDVKPDVIFLDIKMPDGSGFDLLKLFPSINFEVVFITGFDKYALEAFDHNALDYVLKPVDLDKFKQTLDRVRKRIEKNLPDLNLLLYSEKASETGKLMTKIPIHYNNKVLLLQLADIYYIQAIDSGTRIFKGDDVVYNSAYSLGDFETVLDKHANFFRISKTTYINLNYVRSYSKGVECFITMKNGVVMEISQKVKSEILSILKDSGD